MPTPADRERLFARVQQIHAEFDADADRFLETTENLSDEDHRLVGRLIQLYCWADYCGRRIIDAIREAALGPKSRNASRLQNAQVFPKLREAGLVLGAGEVQDTLVRAADILELHYQMRHNFAHWAARRVRDEDVIVILSKNAKEGARRHGLTADEYETNYGFFPVPSLVEEMRKLDQHVHNLSVAAYELEHRIDEMRADFDRRGMHPLRKGTR